VIPVCDIPYGPPMLLATNEISGTVALYKITSK
jgi:hypothetical protein